MTDRETDVCIVGSGIAGAIVAQHCVQSGRSVLMVEAGGRVDGRHRILRLFESTIRDYRMARMKLWRHTRYRAGDYEQRGNQPYELGGKALVVRGGSTLGWGGDAYRMKPEDLELHRRTGRGVDWPLTYAELEPHYVAAEKTLHVAGDHLEPGHPPMSSAFPLPARPFHSRDQRFLDLAGDREWSTIHHPLALATDGGAYTADGLIDELERKTNFSLLTRVVARRLACVSQDRVGSVECWDSSRESELRVRAGTVVVCAGGIETPNLLRASEDRWWPEGLGNHSGHLGRHLISHVGVAVGGRPRGFRFRDGPIGPTAATRAFDSPAEQGAGKYILVWRPAPTGLCFLHAVLEQSPSAVNSVVPGSERTRFGTPRPLITFNYSKEDGEREESILGLLETWFQSMGSTSSIRYRSALAHPMCTSRMASDPVDGVVDENLRLHGVQNAFVCGSASFASGAAANPTLTIAALAHRLGSVLSGDQGVAA